MQTLEFTQQNQNSEVVDEKEAPTPTPEEVKTTEEKPKPYWSSYQEFLVNLA